MTSHWPLNLLYFYPRSPCGERQKSNLPAALPSNFYPRSPCGERLPEHERRRLCQNFYPRSPCGERRPARCSRSVIQQISIHALLAESDLPWHRPAWISSTKFLSTLSLRRATSLLMIRARARSFLSTLSLRRATTLFVTYRDIFRRISIHALLAESDDKRIPATALARHFYPRSPCGERPAEAGPHPACGAFLSTLSLRRATISTQRGLTSHGYFYPRSPCGERPAKLFMPILTRAFLSTLSLRRATTSPPIMLSVKLFLSTLSLRRATEYWIKTDRAGTFLSTLSLRRATMP